MGFAWRRGGKAALGSAGGSDGDAVLGTRAGARLAATRHGIEIARREEMGR